MPVDKPGESRVPLFAKTLSSGVRWRSSCVSCSHDPSPKTDTRVKVERSKYEDELFTMTKFVFGLFVENYFVISIRSHKLKKYRSESKPYSYLRVITIDLCRKFLFFAVFRDHVWSIY